MRHFPTFIPKRDPDPGSTSFSLNPHLSLSLSATSWPVSGLALQMLHSSAAFAVASRISQLTRTAWVRTANRPSAQLSRYPHTSIGRGLSRFTSRAARYNYTSSSIPPPPASGGLAKTSRGLAYVGLGLGAAWYLDNEFYASAVSRNLRTLWIVSVMPPCDM